MGLAEAETLILQLRGEVLALKKEADSLRGSLEEWKLDFKAMNENYDSLQAQHVALKQERDNLAQSFANGAAAYLKQGRELAEVMAALEVEQQERRRWWDATNARVAKQRATQNALDSARASERRLRELLAWAALALPAPWPLPWNIGRSIQKAIEGITVTAEQALTDDPPGQEGER
jgi:chromosome segregation ATPase